MIQKNNSIHLEFVLGKIKLKDCRKQFGIAGSKVLAWLSQMVCAVLLTEAYRQYCQVTVISSVPVPALLILSEWCSPDNRGFVA